MSKTIIGEGQIRVGEDYTLADLGKAIGLGVYNYGPLAADPTTRPDSTAMTEGDEYHNTITNKRRVFNGTAWEDFIGASTADLANSTDPEKGLA